MANKEPKFQLLDAFTSCQLIVLAGPSPCLACLQLKTALVQPEDHNPCKAESTFPFW